MRKYKCDVCGQNITEKEPTLKPLETILQEYIHENLLDVCLECAFKIIEAIDNTILNIKYEDGTDFQKIISEIPKVVSYIPENKKKIIRRKYSQEETLKFKNRLFELITLGTYTKLAILNILDKEFPNRLRTSNAIRLKEMTDRILKEKR